MAGWRVIEHTGLTLVRLLQERLDVEFPPTGSIEVQLASPVSFPEIPTHLRPVVSLFLYRIAEHTETRNAPRQISAGGRRLRQPLGLELHYLVTAWARRSESLTMAEEAVAVSDEHRMLGVVLQTMYDNAEVGRSNLHDDPAGVWGPLDSMQIVKESLSLEDGYRIWDTSELPYRLSPSYNVRVLGLEASEGPEALRVGVAERALGSSQ